MTALTRKKKVDLYVTTFCAWGSPFRKATTFLSANLKLWRLLHHKCRTSRRGIYEFSGHKHVPLHGQNEQGVWRTKVAEPYPIRLCNALAKCFLD